MDERIMPRTTKRTTRKPIPLVDQQFGNRMRALRRGRMWSHAQAVAAINAQLEKMHSEERMHIRTFGAWERGERMPNLGDKVAAVAAVYEVSGDWLLVGEEQHVHS